MWIRRAKHRSGYGNELRMNNSLACRMSCVCVSARSKWQPISHIVWQLCVYNSPALPLHSAQRIFNYSVTRPAAVSIAGYVIQTFDDATAIWALPYFLSLVAHKFQQTKNKRHRATVFLLADTLVFIGARANKASLFVSGFLSVASCYVCRPPLPRWSPSRTTIFNHRHHRPINNIALWCRLSIYTVCMSNFQIWFAIDAHTVHITYSTTNTHTHTHARRVRHIHTSFYVTFKLDNRGSIAEN